MSLVSSETNLRSLKYGSKKPLITKELPADWNGTSNPGLGGGYPNAVTRGGEDLFIGRSLEDTARIGKWFFNSGFTNGPLFTIKQNLLSRSSVKTEASYGGGYAGISKPDFIVGTGGGKINQGAYTPVSTLAQIGAQSTSIAGASIHFNTFGLNPIDNPEFGSIRKYEEVVNSAQSKDDNRLVKLFEGKIEINSSTDPNIISYGGGPGTPLGIGKTNIEFAKGQRTGISSIQANNPDTKDSFYGTSKKQFEPGNYLKSLSLENLRSKNLNNTLNRPWESITKKFYENNGISATTAENVELLQTIRLNSINNEGVDSLNTKTLGYDNPRIKENPNGAATLTGEQLLTQILRRANGTTIQDFRTQITADSIGKKGYDKARKNGSLTSAPNYSGPDAKNYEIRVNAGDPGRPSLDRSDYTKGALDGNGKVNVVNKVNALYMYKKETVTNSPIKNDFVKFRFAVIDPDNPSQKTFIHFPAFFNGAITDNMSAGWDSYKYLGRAEDFYNYTGFSRDVGFGFKVVAQSRSELSIMYQKLNYLQSSMTPNYSQNEGFMRGNIHQLTIGGYFYEQPGILTALNYTMPQDSTWEIGIPSNSEDDSTVGGISYRDKGVKELTHMIDVSVSFKPIHTFLPQIIGSSFDVDNLDGINGKNEINQRYIALTNVKSNGTKDNLYSQGTEFNTLKSP